MFQSKLRFLKNTISLQIIPKEKIISFFLRQFAEAKKEEAKKERFLIKDLNISLHCHSLLSPLIQVI